jgi:hypothetical protein
MQMKVTKNQLHLLNQIIGRIFILLILLMSVAAVTMVFSLVQAHSQSSIQQATDCSGSCLYEAVLNRVFPLPKYFGGGADRLITFRVMPSFGPEWQVVIREMTGGKFRVTYFEPAQEGSIYHFMGLVLEKNKNADADTIVRGLHIRVTTIDSPPPQLQIAIQRFLKTRISTDLGKGPWLDATIYELWEDSAQGSIHIQTSDRATAPGVKLSPLAQWMIEVTNLVKMAPIGAPVTPK